MSNIFYKDKNQEHAVNDIGTSVVIVGTEEIGELEYSYVRAAKDIESVLKLLTEKNSECKTVNKKSFSVMVTENNYAERYELARAYKAGLYFVNGLHIESLVGYSSLDIDEYADQAGVLKNIKRFVASVARQVPFAMTREQAVEKVTNATSLLSCTDDGAESAIELLNKTIDNDVIRYQYSRKITFDTQLVGHFLTQTRPGPEASVELEAYAAKIFKEGGMHVLTDGMGKGKTKHVIRKLIDAGIAAGEKSTVLCHRISISRSNAIAEVVEQYNDDSIKGREDQLQSLSLVINNCDNERFRVHTHQSGIVIIEEAAQVLRHIMQKGFIGDRNDVFHEIIELMKNARLVLICDAFVNDVLMSYVRLAGRVINFAQGRTDYSSTNVCLGSVESTQREVLRALASNKKVLFSSDSRRAAETVARIARDQGKRVLLVTKSTKDNYEVTEFFSSPNEAIKKYDVLCHSPSMQSSVSITDTYFEEHFCIFNGVVGVDDAKQFVKRDRTAKKVVVGITTTAQYAVEKKTVIEQFYSSYDSTFDSIAMGQLRLNAREKNHFRQWLSMSFIIDGFTISRLPTNQAVDNESAKVFKNGRKAVKETITKGTIESRNKAMAAGIFKKLEKTHNEAEYCHNNFIATADATGVAYSKITEDDVKFYNEGAGVAKIKLMSCWILSEDRFNSFANADKRMTGIDKSHYKLKRELLTDLMRKLNISKSERNACAGIISSENLDAACEYIVLRQVDFKVLGIVNIKIKAKSDRQKHALISNALKSMGLAKIRVMVNGEREYALDKKGFNRMCSYTMGAFSLLALTEKSNAETKDHFEPSDEDVQKVCGNNHEKGLDTRTN